MSRASEWSINMRTSQKVMIAHVNVLNVTDLYSLNGYFMLM